MFGKVKKILGIEGVKVEIITDRHLVLQSEIIDGTLKLTTKTASTIESIQIKLIEKYSRGRNDDKLIDEYVLGETIMDEETPIASDEIIEVPFTLEFINARSEMDKMADNNLLLKGPVKLAKWLKKVKSSYRLEAHVKVRETKLQPFATVELKAK